MIWVKYDVRRIKELECCLRNKVYHYTSITMPQFVHLADDKDIAIIIKNGIKASKIYGREEKGIFATPVLQNYYQSHQWLRELKRRGIRTISAIQFRVDDTCPVSIGRYNEPHLDTTAAEAVRIFMDHVTGLGLEVIFTGSIPPKSITRNYTPNQIVGWRYYPEAQSSERKPCGCSYCQRGQIKNRKLQEVYGSD
jgi:hypothetical protein